MSEESIYLDYAATTPVDPRVIDAMTDCLGLAGAFANPSSSHAPGREAKRRVERARRKIAERVGAEVDEIVFTSGATESNNLALKGVMDASREGPAHLVTTRIEHKSVLDTAKRLAKTGLTVEFLETDYHGRVSIDQLAASLARRPARLVSIMHVNNEIGTFQEVQELASVCREHGALLHVDAAQSVGKIPMMLGDWGVDLCSLTAHKICGPKGIGAIYMRRGLRVAPFIHGGEQERGVRAGTLATHQIVGMGEAYELADPAVDMPRIESLRERLLAGLTAIEGVSQNGSPQTSIPNITNLRFPGVDGESLRLGLAGIAVSAGSACNADIPDPSYVLTGIGLSDALANSSLRFSIGRFTTPEEIDIVVERVTAEVARLRALAPSAPAWCSS